MTSSTDQNGLTNRLCLIGEADPFMFLLLRRFVEKYGMLAFHAQTGESILNMVKLDRPAVIILDPELPGTKRGWEVVQQLMVDEETNRIPVVICTWMSEIGAQQLVPQSLAFLQKPDLHFEDFDQVMQKIGIVLL